MQFSPTERFAMHRTRNEGKVPFARREQVNHVIESHGIIVLILELSRVT